MYVCLFVCFCLCVRCAPSLGPQNDSACVQKKAYGCLEVALSVSSSHHQRFCEEHLEELRTLLVDSLSTVSAGSKKVREHCLEMRLRLVFMSISRGCVVCSM